MAEGPLQTWQENSFYRCIRSAKLDPSNFEWIPPDRPAGWLNALDREAKQRAGIDRQQTLTYRPSPSYRFVVRYRPDNDEIRLIKGKTKDFYIEFVPGVETPEQVAGPLNWNELVVYINEWVISLKRNLSEPSMWDQISDHGASFSGIARELGDDGYFGPEEQEQILRRLDSFEQELLGLRDFGPNDVEYLRQEVQDLRDEVSKLTKWKWVKLGLGTVARIGMTLALGHVDFGHLLQAFFNMVHTLPRLHP